jgi:dipeptidyl aminopeptidase/acylaminoacyl peptidase
MAGLAIITAILLWSGDRTMPKVRDFNWQGRSISAIDTAFTLTFNRPVDRTSVEQQLKIAPPLPGKISWAGSKLAYTLTNPAPYGHNYQVNLSGAHEAIGKKQGKEIVPFQGQFRTPDRMFAYIGTNMSDRGRIVIYNFKTQKPLSITPEGLVVTEFKVDNYSQKIVFTAADTKTLQNGQPAIASQQVYSVTTGIAPRNADQNHQFTAPGNISLIFDSQEYQNVKFDLSPDGNKVVVQRLSRRNPNEFALWVVSLDKSLPPSKLKQSGDFVITPDSSEIAAAVGQGVEIFPIVPSQRKNLDFLPKFGNILSFAADGTAAAMVEYNSDYTRSLFVVTNQGIEQQIFKTTGSIWDARFSPAKDIIYCLATELKTKGNTSQEEPFLAAIDVKTQKILLMTLLPIQQGIQMSLSPDGQAILFDQADRGESTNQILQGASNGILWLLPIPENIHELTTPAKAERLSLSGWHPRWLQ